MKLVDTVNGMNSADYKERFIAEYQQLVIRYRGLTSMLYKWDRGIDLGFVPTCPRSTYNMQVKAMTDYISMEYQLNLYAVHPIKLSQRPL